MLTDRISIFENFHSEPKPFTLRQWLNLCKNGSRFTEKVLQYRRTKDPELKIRLPLTTVGALFTGKKNWNEYPKPGTGYRVEEQIVSRSGWIALDIDAKDNPHLTDAEHLRDEVAKIANVAFSGLSTGGAGVWALVKVANPDRQADHFEELIKDFQRFGIVLDSSKGKNPNDARFYSYDPGAIIKDSFTVYKKLPPEPVQTYSSPPVSISSDYSRYAETAFKNELNILSTTLPGNRNNQLFKSSACLAGLVAGGMLDEYEVKQALIETALSIGLKSNELNATIQSGFNAGFTTPRTPDTINRNSVMVYHASGRDSAVNRKYESRNLAPNGFNPYTGEIFDNRGYPSDWDDVEALKEGTPEHEEAEYYFRLDSVLIQEVMHRKFEPEIITE